MLGIEIKKYLDAKGITQTFVAKKTGIAINTLNAMLNGNRGISAIEYFSICDALEISLDTFSKKETA